MKFKLTLLGLLVLLAVSCKKEESKAVANSGNGSDLDEGTGLSKSAELAGASVLAFGPENVLFVGDSKGAKIYAIPTQAQELKDAIPFNMEGFDKKVAEALDRAPRDIIINDMKIHPLSQEAYISIKLGHLPEAKSVIAIASPMTGDIRFLDVPENSTSVSIKQPAAED